MKLFPILSYIMRSPIFKQGSQLYEAPSARNHVQPHDTDFYHCAGVHDMHRQTDRLYCCLQADRHLHSICEGLLPRFAVSVFHQYCTEPGLQDPPATRTLSVTGQLPAHNNPLV